MRMSKEEGVINLQGRVDKVLVLDLVHGMNLRAAKLSPLPKGSKMPKLKEGGKMSMKDNQGDPLEQREELINVREMYFNMDCTTVPIRPVRWRVHHPWFAPIQEAQNCVDHCIC